MSIWSDRRAGRGGGVFDEGWLVLPAYGTSLWNGEEGVKFKRPDTPSVVRRSFENVIPNGTFLGMNSSMVSRGKKEWTTGPLARYCGITLLFGYRS